MDDPTTLRSGPDKQVPPKSGPDKRVPPKRQIRRGVPVTPAEAE